ncbi:hypothetical protein CLU79DRAFT_736137 [Phycomyces nitens]|nr:hypothetical protein CLU79DRAFT_736137 [Phycomyces nitens]
MTKAVRPPNEENKTKAKRGRRKASAVKEHPLAKPVPHPSSSSGSVSVEHYGSLLSLIDATYPPLLCTACDFVSSSRRDSSIHFRIHHPSTPRFLCLHSHCDMRFGSRGGLRFHLSHAHSVGLNLTLPIPPSILTTASKTIASASPPTPPKYTPPKPEPKPTPHTPTSIVAPLSPPPFKPHLVFSTRAPRGSKKIILSPLSEDALNAAYPPLQCPACHQTFNRKTNVIKHLTEDHHGEEPYRCMFQHCIHPRHYATREGLVYHILRAHDDGQPVDMQDASSTSSGSSDQLLEDDPTRIHRDDSN